ncbi:MAG: hypothetical protein BWK76_05310 [Desulfobulbaceae bacterium A2]|nr:MAG: hypothetical protein BWK76_05310 [Desulfobulbaceae bacterium A2]
MSGLLLSIDLEDVRDWVEDGMRYQERVEANTERYLAALAQWGVRATFFIVGRAARRYPALIRRVAVAGHELACHGDLHLQLDKLDPAGFREDLQRNREILQQLGGVAVTGFRAPTFSLTARTAWAHEVLAELGFRYSSSVLPAPNPLYGWPEFGPDCRQVLPGLWELPITLHDLPGLRVPACGGVYFRVLPLFLARWTIRAKLRQGRPVGSYFHPYDIDLAQERFMHPDLNNNRWLNALMYIGRARVLPRLERLRQLCPLLAYGDYVNELAGQGEGQALV